MDLLIMEINDLTKVVTYLSLFGAIYSALLVLLNDNTKFFDANKEILNNKVKDVDLKGLSLEEQYNYIMRRWYDKNIKISHAIEYLRLSPVDLRREVALKVEKYLKELLG